MGKKLLDQDLLKNPLWPGPTPNLENSFTTDETSVLPVSKNSTVELFWELVGMLTLLNTVLPTIFLSVTKNKKLNCPTPVYNFTIQNCLNQLYQNNSKPPKESAILTTSTSVLCTTNDEHVLTLSI